MTETRPSRHPAVDERLAWWVEGWPWGVHHLKTAQPYYDHLAAGFKNFEVRRNDRDFQPSDLLVLHEWTGERFTGEQSVRKVTYVLRDGQAFGVQEGFVVLALEYPSRYEVRGKGTDLPGGAP